MIVADTGAVLALLDADDRHHRSLKHLYLQDPDAWVLPWAILPEVDYLAGVHLGRRTQQAFLADLASGAFHVEWGTGTDLERAHEIELQYADLGLGLVDAVVLAVANRLGTRAIATLDLRHFAAVTLPAAPRLIPRDLPA